MVLAEYCSLTPSTLTDIKMSYEMSELPNFVITLLTPLPVVTDEKGDDELAGEKESNEKSKFIAFRIFSLMCLS